MRPRIFKPTARLLAIAEARLVELRRQKVQTAWAAARQQREIAFTLRRIAELRRGERI